MEVDENPPGTPSPISADVRRDEVATRRRMERRFILEVFNDEL